MALDNDLHKRAIELAPQILPEYLASVIVGMLSSPCPIPALQEHQSNIALDILKLAGKGWR